MREHSNIRASIIFGSVFQYHRRSTDVNPEMQDNMSRYPTILVLAILLGSALPLFISTSTRAPSILSDSIFSGGEADGVDVLPEGVVQLSLAYTNFEDDFTTQEGIGEARNLTVDNSTGEVSISKATRYYGGSETDKGRAIIATSDGGFAFAGSTSSSGAGGSDFWLVKTDSEGNVQWEKTFGGKNNDYGSDLRQTDDGGYVIIGYTYSYGAGNHDIWLIKTDAQGNKQWSRTYGQGGYEYGEGVYQCDDGGYILVGCDYHGGDDPWSEAWLIRTDDQGQEVWNRTYGWWGYFSWGYDVRQVSDGDFVLVGYTERWGNGKKDVWIIKVDDNSNTKWDRTFGGSGFERGYWIEETADQGLIVTGYTSSYGNGNKDILLLKANRNGYEEWYRTFGGTADEEGLKVILAPGGGFVIAGETWTFGSGSNDIYLVRTNSAGIEMWNRTYGGSKSDYSDAIASASGGYAILGTTWSYGEGEYDAVFRRPIRQVILYIARDTSAP